MYRYRRPFGRDFGVFASLLIGWLTWWGLHNRAFSYDLNNHNFVAYMSWAALCSLGTISILYWIGYFRPFKLVHFITDFLAFLLVLPVVGLFFKPACGLIFKSEVIRIREIFFGAFIPAFFAVAGEAFAQWGRSKSSVKSNIYLALTDGETENFVTSIRSGGWEKYYRVLSQQEFDGALASGGNVDYIVISRVATKNFIRHQNILQAQMMGVQILDYRTLYSQLRGHISIHDTDIWTFLAGSVRQTSLNTFYRGLKFYLEPIFAAFMLLLLSPLFILVSILIKATSPGPIFFTQKRTGYLGVDFNLVKFRSMRTDAESTGAQWASKNDNRVTPVGRFLRKTRLDELPQLWNIVSGEMSYIGPRPERPEFYEIIGKQVPHFKLRLMVRPGITGWAQLLGGYAASIEESERKLEFDLYYMQYMSPRMDLIILGRTVLTLLKGDSGQ